MRIITVSNQKGGVAKTTSVHNIAAGLQKLGTKVLMIDLDPQASLSLACGLQPYEQKKTIYEVLHGKMEIKEAIQTVNNMDIVPANIQLSGADLELSGRMRREYILKSICTDLDGYDLVLIDSGPSLSLLNINAITASSAIYVPINLDYFCLDSLSLIEQTVNQVRQSGLNESLSIGGIIITRYQRHLKISKKVLEYLEKNYQDMILKTYIRENVSIKEANAARKSIYDYAINSHGAADYESICHEIIKKENLPCQNLKSMKNQKELIP